MKKLLLLALVMLGGVVNVSAFNDFYFYCGENKDGNGDGWKWATNSNFKFTKISDTEDSYRATIPGSYITSGDWYFRFGDASSYELGPQDNNGYDVSANTLSTKIVNVNGWYDKPAFKIGKNTSALYAQVFITYKNSNWSVSAEVVTSASSYTIYFAKPSGWSQANVHAFVDGVALNDNGSWPGRTMSFNSNNGVYTATITNVIDNSKIIFSDDGSNQTAAISLTNNAVYNTTAAVTTQTVSVNSYGMATYCSQYPLDFSTATITEGTGTLTAYTITDNNKATGALTKSAVSKVPAGTGIYLEGTPGKSFTVSTTVSATSVGDNMLKGVLADTPITQTEDEGATTNYILTVNRAAGGDADTPKFFKVNSAGNTVTANKAYLQIPTTEASRESFWFDGDVTAIEAAKMEQKMEGEVYNLAGQRVAQPTKGLYIVNGKKVIKK